MPASSAAPSLESPSAIAFQNFCRCSRRLARGRPGERIAGRPVCSDAQPFGLPIATLLDRVLRGPLESTQYTSAEFTQELDDNDVLGSLGSTGDAYDNALAESFVDSFKTELIADRTWRSVEQAELAIVEWVSWFNHDRLHSSIGDIPPVEFEQNYAERVGAAPPPGSSRPTGSLRRAAGEQPEPLPSSVKLQSTEAT